MARKVAAVVFSLGCLQASSAMALGLGELKLDSYLNEPLIASVNLLNIGSLHHDEIKIRLATREDFDKLGLERSYFLTSIQFDVVKDDSGTARIVMSTDEPVLEPYLDFILEARWPSGRLLREYTVLIDPPVFSDATPVISASQRVAEVEGLPEETKKNAPDPIGDASGGTNVNVKRSDLAPGEMPQRDFNAETSATPVPGSRYMVARDQTLWDIASKARPEGASVHQTMLDIQRLNPNAFINGNINRLKAGYIVYLPSASDISAGDLDSALAEVQQQNAAWEEGKDAELAQVARPTLRISADVEPGVSNRANNLPLTSAGPVVTDNAAAPQAPAAETGGVSTETDIAAGEGDSDSRLAALEAQLDTLQRIVSLKDEQIAALQNALVEQDDEAPGTALDDMMAAGDVEVDAVVEPFADSDAPAELLAGEEEVTSIETEEAPAVEEAAPAPVAAAEPAPQPRPAPAPAPEAESNWLAWLLYALGALILAVLGFLFVRRRGAAEEEQAEPFTSAPAPAAEPAVVNDVFADVQLKEPTLELDEPEPAPEPAGATDDERGYGQRRHDEYASDMEAADALAEADIYIAYGRHPQAIDLLNNALASEPGNTVYRLKMLEIYTELNDEAAAQDQMQQIRGIGDEDAIVQAQAILGDEPGAPEVSAVEPAPALDEQGLAPNPLEMMDLESQADELEAEFEGLEIEQDRPLLPGEDDDLDLSADFEQPAAEPQEQEELVIAADANGFSTKLDLARAYLDMGDEDGARQILQEVVVEAGDEVKAEAQSLLDRIG